MDVLVVCSANRCRSPMAAALLFSRLHSLGVDACVHSAGTAALPDLPALPDAVACVDGLDAHRSTPLSSELVEHADLVLCATRHHAREVVLLAPDAFPRTFTLLDLARRARPREPHESLEQWLLRVGTDRHRTDLAGTGADDVPDPIGRGPEAFAACAATLATAVDTITHAGWGTGTQV